MSKGLIPTSVIDEAKGGTLRQWLDKADIVRDLGNSLSGWMDPEVFKAQIIVSLNDEKLTVWHGGTTYQCTPESKYKAVLKCAALQLLPGLNQVALIPRKVKDRQGNVLRVEVDVMPQWQGYQALMLRNPEILDIQARLVHVDDSIDFDPVLGQIVKHDYDPFDENRLFNSLEKDVKGGYVVIKYRDRSRPDRHHFVKKSTILKARGCALTQDVWNKWLEEQCIKTLYRNTYARRVVPIDPMHAQKLEELIRHEDQLLGNDPSRIPVSNPADVTTYGPDRKNLPPSEPPKSRGQQLAEQYAADDSEPETNLEDTGEHERDASETAQEPTKAEDPSPEKTKPRGQGKGKQKSLIEDPETEKTRYQKLLDRLKGAADADALTVVIDEAGSWFSEKAITTAEYGELVKQANLRNSELA